MPFPNVAQRRLKQLYHWQRFDAGPHKLKNGKEEKSKKAA
jgi:hypothetical protein